MLPSEAVSKISLPKSSGLVIGLSTVTVSCCCWPAGVGGMPIWPALMLWFCWLMMLTTLDGSSPRWRICAVSSHTRIE